MGDPHCYLYPMVFPTRDSTTIDQVQLCSLIEKRLAFTNPNPKSLTKFHASTVAPISVTQYLTRINKYARCHGDHLLMALFYIDRMIQYNPGMSVDVLSIHRLLITSVVIATKYESDVYYNNTAYAKIGGIPVLELNALEVEFLSKLRFHLYISPDEFTRYKRYLLQQHKQLDSQLNQSRFLQSDCMMDESPIVLC